MSQMPPSGPQPPYVGPTGPVQYLKPHRGTMILVFGILSWVVCIIFGVIAWIMGKQDLAEMDAGLMDPSGRDQTNTGRILGMIHVIVSLCVLGLVAVMFVIFAIIGAFASVHHY